VRSTRLPQLASATLGLQCSSGGSEGPPPHRPIRLDAPSPRGRDGRDDKCPSDDVVPRRCQALRMTPKSLGELHDRVPARRSLKLGATLEQLAHPPKNTAERSARVRVCSPRVTPAEAAS
jgi:hypothetical protein